VEKFFPHAGRASHPRVTRVFRVLLARTKAESRGAQAEFHPCTDEDREATEDGECERQGSDPSGTKTVIYTELV